MVDRIVKSVEIPITVDLEAGFGETLQEIRETVQSIIEIGAVGINIEDADPKNPGHLIAIEEQVEKIRSIKELAQNLGASLFINARTDIFWLNLLTPETRLDEALIRLRAYQAAGADGIFVPGLTDPDLIARITSTITLPLNVLAGSWIKDEEMIKRLRIARLTIGSAGIRVAVSQVKACAKLYIENKDCSSFIPSISYDELNQLLLPSEH